MAALSGILGTVAEANPYGAAANAVGGLADSVMSALSPPEPPNFSTKATNRFQNTMANPILGGGLNQNFGAGTQTNTNEQTSTPTVSPTMRATAEGGQGNQQGSAGDTGTGSSLFSSPIALIVIGIVVVVFFMLRRK